MEEESLAHTGREPALPIPELAPHAMVSSENYCDSQPSTKLMPGYSRAAILAQPREQAQPHPLSK